MLPANFLQPGQLFLQADLVRVPPVLDAVVILLQGLLPRLLGLLLRFVRAVLSAPAASSAAADAFSRTSAQPQRIQQRQSRLCGGDQPV